MYKALVAACLLFPLGIYAEVDATKNVEATTDFIAPKQEDEHHAGNAEVLGNLEEESGFELAGIKFKTEGFFSAAGAFSNVKNILSPTPTVPGEKLMPKYQGIGKDITFSSDSLIGLQLDASVTEQVDVVLQVVARAKPRDPVTDKYELNANWAYLNYQVKDNFSLKAGRILIPLYLLSQYVDVAYGYPWVKPPQEVYGTIPIPSSNGLIGDWIMNFSEEWQLEVQPFFFANDTKFALGNNLLNLDLVNFGGFSANISNDWLQVKALYTEGTISLNQGNPIPLPIPPGSTSLLPGLHTKASFLSFGLRVDRDNFLILSEYTLRKIANSYLNDTEAWYVLGGVRIDKLMPMVTYAEVKALNKGRVSSLPAAAQPFIASLFFQEQKSIEVGVRYDAAENVALKASVLRVTPLNGSRGLFDVRPGQKSVNIYNAGVNVVF